MLCDRQDVDQTSPAEVEEQAGYSRGLDNHHVGSNVASSGLLAWRTHPASIDSLDMAIDDGLEALVVLADTYLTVVQRHAGLAPTSFAIGGSAFREWGALRSVFAGDDGCFRSGVTLPLQAGHDSGAIDMDVDRVVSAALALVGTLRGIGAQFVVDPPDVDVPAARHVCVQSIRRSFGSAHQTDARAHP